MNLQQNNQAPSSGGGSSSLGNAAQPTQGNLRAKWTRAITGTEMINTGGPQSPNSNSYRHSKTNNVSSLFFNSLQLMINTQATSPISMGGNTTSPTSNGGTSSGGYIYKKNGGQAIVNTVSSLSPSHGNNTLN